jgi:hypothetical protein
VDFKRLVSAGAAVGERPHDLRAGEREAFVCGMSSMV